MKKKRTLQEACNADAAPYRSTYGTTFLSPLNTKAASSPLVAEGSQSTLVRLVCKVDLYTAQSQDAQTVAWAGAVS